MRTTRRDMGKALDILSTNKVLTSIAEARACLIGLKYWRRLATVRDTLDDIIYDMREELEEMNDDE